MSKKLRDYQKEGIKWLYNCYSNKRGCILGDDMGLGKTIQIIGLSMAILNKPDKNKFGCIENIKNESPILIICPKSVLFQWKEEYEKWGNFKVTIFHSSSTVFKQFN
ncbi:DNA excision repair protein ERCC-6-like 2 [Bonamia ostreae]|uniref:DNA excision repair protein ERCC-6-like 2 n=1 Tax=Bonamia ostreae TaxID=126728 RepID=A0ABV2AHH0_9EUKA